MKEGCNYEILLPIEIYEGTTYVNWYWPPCEVVSQSYLPIVATDNSVSAASTEDYNILTCFYYGNSESHTAINFALMLMGEWENEQLINGDLFTLTGNNCRVFTYEPNRTYAFIKTGCSENETALFSTYEQFTQVNVYYSYCDGMQSFLPLIPERN